MKAKPDRDCRAGCSAAGGRFPKPTQARRKPKGQELIVQQLQEVVRLSTPVPKLWKELDLVQAGLR